MLVAIAPAAFLAVAADVELGEWLAVSVSGASRWEKCTIVSAEPRSGSVPA